VSNIDLSKHSKSVLLVKQMMEKAGNSSNDFFVDTKRFISARSKESDELSQSRGQRGGQKEALLRLAEVIG
jgi:hypothetical protein